MAEGDDPTDRGFTLIETIVVVLMVAVLSSVIVAVIAVILRNVPTTEARADDSRSYQRLIQWLPRPTRRRPRPTSSISVILRGRRVVPVRRESTSPT